MANGKFQEASNDFYKSSSRSKDFVTNTDGPSLTRQEFAEECDINTLMAKYDTHVIGGPGNLPPMEPVYTDFTTAPSSLLEYMTLMIDAEKAFMSLPAVVRREFDNSAQMFVDFASDPENLDQMRTWGLAPPAKAPEAPMRVEVVTPAAPPEASKKPPEKVSTHGST